MKKLWLIPMLAILEVLIAVFFGIAWLLVKIESILKEE